MMKRIIERLTITVLLLIPFNLVAGDLKVESFTLQLNDLTEITDTDNNGRLYALIKVRTTIQNLAFDAGAFGGNTEDGTMKMVKRTGEIWLYVPEGTKKLQIRHDTYGTLDVVFKEVSGNIRDLEANGKYLMVLNATTDSRQIRQLTQYVSFDVYPKDAVILIEGQVNFLESESENSSRGFKRLGPFGVGDRYDYVVSSEGYHSQSGAFTVAKDVYTVKVDLASSKASVNVECDMLQADIYIDGNKVGQGTWNGSMLPGWHEFESKREGYAPVKNEVFIEENGKHDITIPNPVPIYGSLDISGHPQLAEVYVDDSLVGLSPLIVNEVIIGRHDIKIKKEGYKNDQAEVLVKKDSTSSLSFELNRQIIVPSRKDTSERWLQRPVFYAGAGLGYDHGLFYGVHIGVMERDLVFEASVTTGKADMTINWTQTSSVGDGYVNDVITYKYIETYSISFAAGYRLSLFGKLDLIPVFGCKYNQIKGICTNKPDLYSDQTSWALCWQAGTKLGYYIGRRTSVFLDSRYESPVTAGKLIGDTKLLWDWNTDISVLLGVNYSF